jgi:hypothetical protein
MRLNKMMSKFERDLWLLRKYCRQNGVSRSLTIRMKRYVDMVLIPKFHKMSAKDVVLLPLLSLDLREELQTELTSKQLRMHPFFAELENKSKNNWNKTVMKRLCNNCIDMTPLARGDLVFSSGEVAHDMVLCMTNTLLYTPYLKSRAVVEVETGDWISEACLWMDWHRQGQLQANQEANILTLHSEKFQKVVAFHGLVQAFAKRYADAFLTLMNQKAANSNGEIPSDLQDDIGAQINIHKLSGDETTVRSTPNLLTDLLETVTK